MYPHERSLVKHLQGKPFALIGVNSDQKLSTPLELASTGEVTWRSFQNEYDGGSISKDWGVKGWPTVVLIDGEGKIRYREHGKDLDKNLAMLFEEIGEEFPLEAIHATTAEERGRVFGAAAEKDQAGDDPTEEEAAAGEQDATGEDSDSGDGEKDSR